MTHHPVLLIAATTGTGLLAGLLAAYLTLSLVQGNEFDW